jgi:ubiquinone/menaquinone biosynthesis C-methylase UbiE
MQPINSMQQTFDTVAQSYDHPALAFFDAIAQHLVNAIPASQFSRLLDIATGTGKVALLAAAQHPTAHITGIDLSTGMLQQARQKAQHQQLSNLEFVQMNMETLAFPDQYFDIATCSAGVFFFADMVKGLQHIASKVKPGGKVIISAFDEDAFEPMASIFFKRYETYGYRPSKVDLPRLVNDEQLTSLFTHVGLHPITIRRSVYQAPLHDFEDWWYILRNTSYRDMFTPMSEAAITDLKDAHQQEIQHLIEHEDPAIKVSFSITCADIPVE